MTIPNYLNKKTYTGNGVTTQFPYPFKIFAASDIQVILTDIATNVDTLLASNYLVDTNGCSVTYPVIGRPLTADTKITLNRVVPITQETSLTNGGAYYASVIEKALDKCTIIDQQQQEQISRSLRHSVSVDETVSSELPAPVPLHSIRWDVTGKKFETTIDPASAVDAANSAKDIAVKAAADAQELMDGISASKYMEKKELFINIGDYCLLDGVNDDSPGLLEAITAAKSQNMTLHLSGNKTLKISQTIDASFLDIDFRGKVIVDMADGVGLIVGDSSYYGNPRNIYIKDIRNATAINARSDSQFTLQFQGLMNAMVEVLYCDSLRFYVDGDTGANSNFNTRIHAIAYSTFKFGNINFFYIVSKSTETSQGWINENLFINGRFRNIEIGNGKYRHQQNIFIKPCFENGLLWLKSGEGNVFYSARTEGASIKFEATTNKNIIFDSFYSNYLIVEKQSIVTYDYGNENEVVSTLESVYSKCAILDLIPNVTFRSIADSKYVIPDASNRVVLDASLNFLTIYNYASIFDQIIDTSILKRFKIDYTPNDVTTNNKGLLVYIQCYDASMAVLTPSSTTDIITWDLVASGILWDIATSRYLYSGMIGTQYFLFNNRVKFVKFNIQGGYLAANTGFNCKRLVFSGFAKPFEVEQVKIIESRILKDNIIKSGTTTQRPTTNRYVGQQYFDTTLSKVLFWSGTAWKDAAGTTV